MAEYAIELVYHLNQPNDEGKVYCRLSHSIREWEPMNCMMCPLCRGFMQSTGVECIYPDLASGEDEETPPVYVTDPEAQLKQIDDLVQKGFLPLDPIADMSRIISPEDDDDF